MIIASLSEIISIGLVYPFLAAIISPESIFKMPYASQILKYLNAHTKNEIVFVLSILFASSALLAGAVRFYLIIISTRLSFSIGIEISAKMLNNTLKQNYETHCSRNSSEIIDGQINKSSSIIYSIMNIVTFISSTLMAAIIFTGLVFASPAIAISVLTFFFLVYLIIIFAFKSTISKNSKFMADGSSETVKILQETLGGIRDIIIDNRQSVVAAMYNNAHNQWRRAQAQNLAISSTPRYILESAGMIFIALLAYNLTVNSDGINNALPILGMLALSAQRLLPIIQQLYNSWVEYQSNRHSVLSVLKIVELNLPIQNDQHYSQILNFKSTLTLRNVNFNYCNSTTKIFENINLEINKGDFVGIYGPSGSGKSTLVDIIVGLLIPTSGEVLIDGCKLSYNNIKAWRDNIAYVSQSPFLNDASLLENIAYGIKNDQIDTSRVIEAATKAKIDSVINKLPDQYNTKLGERGVKFSGGQRQRISIARALYKKSSVIIFDEATSALDMNTEDEIMKTIYSLRGEVTLILISHRISCLSQCNRVFKMAGNNIVEVNI